jgi:hypothetical protein
MPEDTAQAVPQGVPTEQAQAVPASFDEWLKGQDEPVRKLYETHTAGLRSALQSEREARKTETGQLAKQLREAAAKAEAGSEHQRQLQETAAKLDATERRAEFYEESVRPEIGCSNPKLAWLAAQEIGAMDQKGRTNWEALKQSFPELFKVKITPGNAGSGAGTPLPGKGDMNAFIRRSTGRT